MKTIKQIADELGVSKQAVHQKRKSAALSTALQPFTSTVDGVVYISVDGEKLLKQAFLKQNKPEPSTDTVNEFTPVDDNKFTPVDGHVDTPEHPLYAILKSELDAKNRQIEQLTAQLAELAQANKELAQSINADRRNQLAGTLKEMLPEAGTECQDETAVDVVEIAPEPQQPVPEEKPGFFTRLDRAIKAFKGV